MASTINASSTGSGGLITTGDASGELALQANGVTKATVTANGLSLSSTASINALNTFGFENRLINGDFRIDQRNSGSVYSMSASVYTLDRWLGYTSQTNKYTVQQNAGSVTPPAGYVNYLGVTSSSAYTLAATDQFFVSQYIEGYNSADLAFGTASAKTVTLSFWVRSSLTGSFGGALSNAGLDRNYLFSYTINSANTWEQKFVTIAGDTSGTWLQTTGIGMRVEFNLGTGTTYSGAANTWLSTLYVTAPTGSTSVVSTNGATWYVTGVQFEAGSQATSFDFRSIGTEFALCQRYFQQVPSARFSSGTQVIVNYMFGSTDRIPLPLFPVIMRAVPTAVSFRTNGTTTGETTEFSSSTNRVVTSIPNIDAAGGGYLQCSTSFSNPTNLNLTFSAEL
jgi:hypothetical protein